MTRDMIMAELKRSLDAYGPITNGDSDDEGPEIYLCNTADLADHLIADLERAGLKLTRA